LAQQKECVIIDARAQPIAIIMRTELIDYLNANRDKIACKLKSKLSEVPLERRAYNKKCLSAVHQTFQVLWEKQLNGMVAASKLGSAVDGFLTWVKYAATIDESDLSEEPEVVSNTENLKFLLDLFARRTTVRWVLVKNKKDRSARLYFARKDLLATILRT